MIDGHRTPGGPAVHPARLAQAVLGTATVALIGLVALEAFGPAVALVALAIAAVYPALIELSGTVYSENLLIPLMLAAMWAGLRARRSDRPYRWVAAAGVLTGLATLTHQNGVVVLVGAAAGGVADPPRPAAAPRADRPDDCAVDGAQRDRASPLHPGLGRDRSDARRHLQPDVGTRPPDPVPVALLQGDPRRRGAVPQRGAR